MEFQLQAGQTCDSYRHLVQVLCTWLQQGLTGDEAEGAVAAAAADVKEENEEARVEDKGDTVDHRAAGENPQGKEKDAEEKDENGGYGVKDACEDYDGVADKTIRRSQPLTPPRHPKRGRDEQEYYKIKKEEKSKKSPTHVERSQVDNKWAANVNRVRDNMKGTALQEETSAIQIAKEPRPPTYIAPHARPAHVDAWTWMNLDKDNIHQPRIIPAKKPSFPVVSDARNLEKPIAKAHAGPPKKAPWLTVAPWLTRLRGDEDEDEMWGNWGPSGPTHEDDTPNPSAASSGSGRTKSNNG